MKDTVYVVEAFWEYEPAGVIGVFSYEDDAEDFAESQRNEYHYDTVTVNEWEVSHA